MTNLPPRYSRFDHDPEALAWARAKVQAEIDRADEFATQLAAATDPENADRWAFVARHLRRTLLGDTDSCVMGRFDTRLPELAKAIDGALPAPIDRAVRRDHSLCGAEPCSDCR